MTITKPKNLISKTITKKNLKTFPFWYFVAIVVISLIVKENFPFSHFPMYSKFGNWTFYLYITDENDKMFQFKKEFGVSASHLKKMWKKHFYKSAEKVTGEKKTNIDIDDKEIRKVMWESGKTALRQMVSYRDKKMKCKKLKLWFAHISRDGKKIIERKELISELNL